ncbi:S-adenosyl-L-methionine-dependent methyltransferase [Schizophyllum commune]
MAKIWEQYGPGTDQNSRAEKEKLIRPHANGVVVDAGAGHGVTALYLDRTKVTKYVAVEPNVAMHEHIRRTAASVGFTEDDGSLVVLGCGIEDVAAIRAALRSNKAADTDERSSGVDATHADPTDPCADTVISVLTLCSIPNPQSTIRTLVHDLLAPGGTLLFYEHVLSHRADVAWWQRFWAPVWRVPFDGCRLDQPTYLWIAEAGDVDVLRAGADKRGRERGDEGREAGSDGEGGSLWAIQETWGKEGETEDTLFWHQAGRFVKRR